MAGSRGLVVGNDDVLSSATTPSCPNHYAAITWDYMHDFAAPFRALPLAVGGVSANTALYASLYDFVSANGRTLRSDDDGANWTPLDIPPYSSSSCPAARPRARLWLPLEQRVSG